MNSYLIEKYGTIEITGQVRKNESCMIDSITHGLFACFYCILYGLYICEMEDIHPVVVLGEKHLYFEKERGGNVFEYFYRKSHRKSEHDLSNISKITISDPGFFLSWGRISASEKTISNLLINKYFVLRSSVKKQIEHFCEQHLKDLKTVGVHFRGTDKVKETPLLDFGAYEHRIDLMLTAGICDKFFFATDELHLRTYVREKYGEKAIMHDWQSQYAARTGNEGLHFSHTTPYLSALDALTECYILSKCQFLLSSSKSSMSLFATFLNPDLLHLVIEP